MKPLPALPKDADQRDLELAEMVVQVLDQEYGTKVPPIDSMSLDEKLAFLVKYMWKVFGYAFYSGVRCEDERCVSLKCFNYERQPATDITREDLPAATVTFESNYVKFAELLVTVGPQPLQDPQQDSMLLELKMQYCIDSCEKISGEKFNCDICKKGFCGEEFVYKHINNKHSEIIQDKVCAKYFRGLARDSYIRDKDRIESAPIAYQYNPYQP